MDVGPRLDELRCEPKRFRRRVRVLEATRVGDERDVERLRDLRRQLDVEFAEEVAQHFAGRRRVRDDEVDLPEAGVVVVMVDVDRERHASEDLGIGDAALVRAIHGEQDPLGDVVRPAPPQLCERHEGVLARQRRVAR